VVGGIHAGIYYLHGDHLGSLQALSNASGQVVQRLTYKPFGETFSNTGSVDFEQHRFTGQEQDPETGLYFYHARYYNPVLGRFLSPDALVPDPGNPQSLNRYSYVGNNPVNLTDPSGHSWLSKFFHRAIAPVLRVVVPIVTVVVSIAAAVAQQYWAIPIVAAAGSAAETALNHGNAAQILESAGIGAGAAGLALGVGWAANATLASITSPALAEFGSTVAAAGAGGFAQGAGQARVMGASWSEAFRSGYQTAAVAAGTAAVASAASAFYNETVSFKPNPLPGDTLNPGMPDEGVYKWNSLGQPPSGMAVFGSNVPLTGDFWADVWKQGGFIGKLGNSLFSGNAIAALHDTWVNQMTMSGTFNQFNNISTMFPALVVTEAALLSDPAVSVEFVKSTREDKCCR
jgi:RHS repeat-associated protein